MRFESLTRYLDSLPGMGVPGCELTVMIDHEPIYRHRVGEGRPGRPIDGSETYWFYSATKLYTMTTAMIAAEKGLFHLDDPVSQYLPEFANLTVRDGDGVRPARTPLTIRHLMSMQGGLNYNLNAPAIRACIEQYGEQASTRRIAAALASQPLDFEPGTHFCYSLCHDVVAAVIEAAAQQPFGEFMSENLMQPLGIPMLTFHPNAYMLQNLAACYTWDERQNPQPRDPKYNPYVFSPTYESGGAGLIGTPSSYILLPDALANGGVGMSGKRILTRESIDEMRRNQLTGASRADFDTFLRYGYSYGLGVRTLVDNRYSPSPIGEFGWDGAAGAWTLVDPDHHMAAFYAQHVHSCGRAYDEFHPTIRNLIYEGLNA